MKSFETTTELLPHQKLATQYLLPSRLNALFMGPGTGKTRTMIELLKIRQHKIDKVIWFCPVSLRITILGEILKHTNVNYNDVCILDEKINANNVPNVSWYIVGIESLSQSVRSVLVTHQIITNESTAILDESAYCKNHFAKRSMRITKFCENVRYRAILTGTPISNGIADLFAQFYFLSPKILGYQSFYSFSANHLEYSDKYPNLVVRAHNTEYLAAKIKPYTYQVTKEECLSLPAKNYETSFFEMNEEQAEEYHSTKNYYLERLEYDQFKSHMIFLLFNRLQQIISGFKQTKQGIKTFKHDRVNTLLRSIQGEPASEKIIIWAKFQYDIESIAAALREAYGHHSVALYYGKINASKRKIEEDKFRNNARFFLATGGTGGHGLTLVESSIVKIYNRSFKFSENEQLEDRNHRIGQENIVTYEDIHCVNSIDNRIWQSYIDKGNVLEDFKAEVARANKDRMRELIKSL